MVDPEDRDADAGRGPQLRPGVGRVLHGEEHQRRVEGHADREGRGEHAQGRPVDVGAQRRDPGRESAERLAKLRGIARDHAEFDGAELGGGGGGVREKSHDIAPWMETAVTSECGCGSVILWTSGASSRTASAFSVAQSATICSIWSIWLVTK